ncbi:MAG: TlpA disulfide reductase family protein [Oscillospiraceae bacterium]
MKDKKQIIALASVGVLLAASIILGVVMPYIKNKDTQNPPKIEGEVAHSEPSEGAQDKERYPVPDFTFTDLAGKDVLFSDFVGKPIVLNFWATWCPHCVGEMGDFDTLIGEYGGKVNFIMMDALDGQQETLSAVNKYLDKQQFKNLVPHLDKYGEALSVFGVTSFPTTVFIDSEGNMYNAVIGATGYNQVKEILDGELGEG